MTKFTIRTTKLDKVCDALNNGNLFEEYDNVLNIREMEIFSQIL